MSNAHGGQATTKQKKRSKPSAPVPSMAAFNDATSRIRRTEWFGSVVVAKSKSSVGYSQEISLDNKDLPVLSKLAAIFDKYVVNSIDLVYKGSVSSTRDGAVHLAFDYDAKAKDPESLSSILGHPNVSGAVWISQIKLPLKFDKSTRYVRGTDVRDKLGKLLWYATTTANASASITLGEVYINYDITFSGLDA